MEIHKYEKLWFGLSLLLIVAFIGTITYGAVGVGVQMVSDDGGTVDPDNIGEHEKFEDWPQQRAQHVEGDQYEVAVQAVRFNFLPGGTGPIKVPENSEVTFYITSPDVTHGFNIVGTNVNTMVIPGQVTKVTVEFEDPGTYNIVCAEYCGSAHHLMEGTVEVLPQSEFEEVSS